MRKGARERKRAGARARPREREKELGRSNAADGPASLRCNALLGGGLRPLRCCVAHESGLYYFSLSRSRRLSGNTDGENGKRGGHGQIWF